MNPILLEAGIPCVNCDNDPRTSHLCPVELVKRSLHPVTIIADRYGGSYSKGAFLAFNLDEDWVPEDGQAGDTECMEYWDDPQNSRHVGKGNTPDRALADLITKLEALEKK